MGIIITVKADRRSTGLALMSSVPTFKIDQRSGSPPELEAEKWSTGDDWEFFGSQPTDCQKPLVKQTGENSRWCLALARVFVTLIGNGDN